MKKRIVCLLLAMVLALGVVSEVSAVELHGIRLRCTEQSGI